MLPTTPGDCQRASVILARGSRVGSATWQLRGRRCSVGGFVFDAPNLEMHALYRGRLVNFFLYAKADRGAVVNSVTLSPGSAAGPPGENVGRPFWSVCISDGPEGPSYMAPA